MDRYLELTRELPFVVSALVPVLLALGWWASRGVRPRANTAVTLGLALAAALSVMWYTRSHIESNSYSNRYEMFHYYLPARYAQEVGYTHMYDAAVAAAAQLGVPPVDKVRDLRSGDLASYAKILERAPKTRARFTPERWDAWVEDVSWFVERVSPKLWDQMLEDRGYNATPVWTMVWSPLAEQVRAGSAHGQLWLSLIDVVLWLVTLACVGLAFGPRPALVMITVLGVHFVTSFTTLKAAFVRVDWVCALLGAMALERRGRSGWAGALVAWAGMSRVFPFLFAFGPVVALLHGLLRERRLDRRAARFVVALIGTAAILGLASVAATSVAYWRAFAMKIGELADVYSNWRVGFAYVLAGAWDGRGWGGARLESFYEQVGWLLTGMRLVALAGFGWLALRIREPWERLVLGVPLMFFLVGALYYYYVVLMIPALWLATRPADWRAVGALWLMFLGSTAAYLSADETGRSAATFFVVSSSVLVLVACMAWIMARPAPSDVGAAPGITPASPPPG